MFNVYHMQRLRPLSNCPNSWPTKVVSTFTFTDWPYVWNRPPFFHNDAADGEEDSSASAQVRIPLKDAVQTSYSYKLHSYKIQILERPVWDKLYGYNPHQVSNIELWLFSGCLIR